MYGRNYSQHGSNYGGYRQSYQAPPPPPKGYSVPQGVPAWQGPPQPPPGADPQLWQWFTAVDADRSGAITVQELQSALLNGTSAVQPLDRYARFNHCLFLGNWTS